MEILESHLDVNAPEFKERQKHNEGLARELRHRMAEVRARDAALLEKHTSRGKLFVHERIEKLLDPGTPFLELSSLAAWVPGDSRNRRVVPPALLPSKISAP